MISNSGEIYSLAGYQLGLRNGLVVLVGGLNIFLFSTLFGGLVAETTNQTGCSVEWCFGSSQLTNTGGQADTEIVVPLSGDSSFIRDFPLPHWACQDSMLSQCLALPHILWVCLFQWEIPIYDDLWQFQWGTSDSRSGSGGNLEPSRTWKTIGWNPWFPMDFSADFGRSDTPFSFRWPGAAAPFSAFGDASERTGLIEVWNRAWHDFIHGFHSYQDFTNQNVRSIFKKWPIDVHSDYPVVRGPRSYGYHWVSIFHHFPSFSLYSIAWGALRSCQQFFIFNHAIGKSLGNSSKKYQEIPINPSFWCFFWCFL